MRTQLFAAAIVSALTATSASAAVVLSGDSGGKMEEYAPRFQQAACLRRDRGDQRHLLVSLHDGAGFVPRHRVCATEN